jgi:hypothetical protein
MTLSLSNNMGSNVLLGTKSIPSFNNASINIPVPLVLNKA